MIQGEIKPCRQLNKKISLVTMQVRLRLWERKEGFKYYYYYDLYYCCYQYKCSTAISISKVEAIYYLTKIHPSRKPIWQRAEKKKTSRKAGTVHQLQMKINIFVHTTSQLPKQHWVTVASYFPDEIADYIFDQGNQTDKYFKFNF